MSAQKSSSLLIAVQEAAKSVQNEGEHRTNPSVLHDGIKSENLLSRASRTKHRVPVFMKEALRQNILALQSSQNQKDEATMKKKSKIGSTILNSIKKMRNIIKCQICECEMNTNVKRLSMCECQHNSSFCQSCLHHYVIYKVKMFQQVPCPRDGCSVLLDTKGLFFIQLPIDIQKNYKRLHQFYQTANDPHKRLCPKQNCEGIIFMTPDQLMICNICLTQFCPKCLLAKHEGECDQKEVEFFQNTLHYRQCKSCKFIVERFQGCNHMTCRCSHQFCYVCGVNWDQAHYGNHDQNGNLIGIIGGEPQEGCCCDCQCCQQICGQTCACILKTPMKLFFLLLLLVFMLFLFITRDVVVIIVMFLVSIIAGMFGYSFSYLCQLNGIFCLLGVLFFPICMIVGVGISFKEIFSEVISDICEQEWSMYGEAFTNICQL